jgi:hypothetical protein
MAFRDLSRPENSAQTEPLQFRADGLHILSPMGHLRTRWNALAVALAVMTMAGCQGFSTGKTASQNSPPPPPGALSAAPASLSFGNVQIGASQNQSDTLTNLGGTTVTITQSAVTGSGFSVTGLSLPVTLAAGQSSTFSVVFNPQAAGSVSGNLALTSDAADGPLNIAISGTGVAAGSLTTNPASFTFGSVQVGSSQTQTETLTNSGGENITLSQVSASGAGFSFSGLSLPLTLAPNQSTTFGVVFGPTAAGASNGSLALTLSGSTTPINLALSGTGIVPATLTATPASLAFGSVVAGQTSTLSETVKNVGGASATISVASVSGNGFSVSGLTVPLTLTAGQSATFNVVFSPPTSGSFSGSVSITSTASNPNLTISLGGTGTVQSQGQLSVSPATISVGNVTVGTSGTQAGTLSATGASVTVSSDSVGGSEFVISGLAFPLTILAGQSANFTVTFTPQTSGFASVSASFTSNASNASAPATITGTGVAAPVHSVNLSWNASTSPNVVGYNIYRSTGSGGSYSQINTVLNATTTYTDSSVVDGQTYSYETTAVNSDNEESVHSAPVQAVIPPP